MKVKELIEQLRTLDQEREIWVLYDTFIPQEPEIEVATKETERNTEGVIRKGDYLHAT